MLTTCWWSLTMQSMIWTCIFAYIDIIDTDTMIAIAISYSMFLCKYWLTCKHVPERAFVTHCAVWDLIFLRAHTGHMVVRGVQQTIGIRWYYMKSASRILSFGKLAGEGRDPHGAGPGSGQGHFWHRGVSFVRYQGRAEGCLHLWCQGCWGGQGWHGHGGPLPFPCLEDCEEDPGPSHQRVGEEVQPQACGAYGQQDHLGQEL